MSGLVASHRNAKGSFSHVGMRSCGRWWKEMAELAERSRTAIDRPPRVLGQGLSSRNPPSWGPDQPLPCTIQIRECAPLPPSIRCETPTPNCFGAGCDGLEPTQLPSSPLQVRNPKRPFDVKFRHSPP